MSIKILLEPLISIIYAKLFKAIFLEPKKEKSKKLVRNVSSHDQAPGKKVTFNGSYPHISRMLMDRPVLCLPRVSDELISSTSQSNKLA